MKFQVAATLAVVCTLNVIESLVIAVIPLVHTGQKDFLRQNKCVVATDTATVTFI